MNEREISEIRRRFRPDRNNITHVRGCYVNEQREIVSEFYQSIALLPQTESEELLATLKKALSVTLGKNLIDIEFRTRQVAEGEEHRLLMALRNSDLHDKEALHAFFQKVIASVSMEGSYMILLTCDSYDVPYKGSDDEDFAEGSDEVYRYILCAVCPVKLTKPALTFHAHENAFCRLSVDHMVAPPQLGFLFPAFDERSTNLYGALYYCKDAGDNHKEFVDAVFNAPIPMPAKAQKETFETLLGETLEEECSYEVVQAVQDQLCTAIAAHKEAKIRQPLTVDADAVCRFLTDSGVSSQRTRAFSQRYDEAFGPDAALSPRNLVDTKQTQLSTSDVKIQVDPRRGDLVQIRLIDGERCIVIRAEEGVEVNGVPVHIP